MSANRNRDVDIPVKKPRILVVDDDVRNRRLLEAMLSPQGYDVHLAEDGEESVEKAKEIQPDLILMDVMMPKLDGFAATERLKHDDRTSDIPVVIVTALQDVEDKVKALDLGADDFIRKPVEQIELRARVRSLLKVKAYNDHMREYRRILEVEVDKKTGELREALVRIKEASLDTIFRLSRAAEFKDERTGNHIFRVSHYAALLARTLGLNEAGVETVLYAAPLHDIGKIGIPEAILLKPGGLDPEEWETMKLHTVIGAQILEGSRADFIKVGEIIALSHHEKWDGSGYPHSLKGEKIPLEARITAVADVFDALTSDRLYRKALSLEEAFSIIQEGRGSHFDPRLVDYFFQVAEKILAIKALYQDGLAKEPRQASRESHRPEGVYPKNSGEGK